MPIEFCDTLLSSRDKYSTKFRRLYMFIVDKNSLPLTGKISLSFIAINFVNIAYILRMIENVKLTMEK